MSTIGRLGALVCATTLVAAAPAHATDYSVSLDARLTSFTKRDVGKKGGSSGDTIQFTDRLRRSGKRAGRDAATCTYVDRVFYQCDWTVVFRRGSVQVHGLAHDTNAGYTLAITGGTGRYAGARGTMRVTNALKAVARYELRFSTP